MQEHTKLLAHLGCIFGSALVLVAGVIAYDRRDEVASIGHLFDFHLDATAAREYIELEQAKKEKNEQIQREWCIDLGNDRSGPSDGPGTCTAPDRDR